MLARKATTAIVGTCVIVAAVVVIAAIACCDLSCFPCRGCPYCSDSYYSLLLAIIEMPLQMGRQWRNYSLQRLERYQIGGRSWSWFGFFLFDNHTSKVLRIRLLQVHSTQLPQPTVAIQEDVTEELFFLAPYVAEDACVTQRRLEESVGLSYWSSLVARCADNHE